MSLENRTESFPSLKEHLGNPDFVGFWEQGESSCDFDMHILTRRPMSSLVEAFRFREDEVDEKAEVIEGVIFDQYGLSIFDGLLKPDYFIFIKSYSESAKMKGASRDKHFYKGQYYKEQGFYAGYHRPYSTLSGRQEKFAVSNV